MKKLLFVLLIFPFVSNAQNFEFGLNGGINFHSLPYNNTYRVQDKPILGYAASVRGALILPKVQIGVEVAMVSLVETNFLMPVYTTKVYNYIANPLITTSLFINRTHNFAGGYVYYGLAAGPGIARVGINSWDYKGPNATVSGYHTDYTTITAYVTGGIQGGAVFNVHNHFSVSGEVAVRYTNFNYKDAKTAPSNEMYHYQMLFVPITIGIRYRI
ncbi:MAG: hypothetical protein H0X33_08465 [Taibaiella sp.]|nr:hypothetical protein [Taibaiella sp.]